MKNFKKSWGIDLSVGCFVVLALFAAYALRWSPTEGLEYRAYDSLSRLRNQSPASNVVVIAIDNDSIAAIGRWPWPRGVIAQMIDRLQANQARVIGVDLPYPEKDAGQGLREIRNFLDELEAKGIQSGQIYTGLKEVAGRLDNDALLADAIAASGRVVLPMRFVPGSTLEAAEALPDYLKRNSVTLPATVPILTAREVIPPLAEFAAPAQALGHITTAPDKDGAVRSEPLLIRYGNRCFPSFALQLTLKFLNYNLNHLRLGEGIEIGNARIPTFAESRMLIRYSREVPVHSFVDIVSHRVPPEVFKNKIALIALTATGLGSLQTTPLGADTPAWVGTAGTVNTILNQDHLRRPAWAFWLELGAMVLFGCFAALAVPRLSPLYGAFASLALLLLWIGAGAYLLAAQGYWIKMVHPALVLLLGHVLMASRAYLSAEKPRESLTPDSAETNKMLGLSYQGQGMLDLAFETLRKCPVEDKAMKELLYNLGLDFERKRMFPKAAAVYKHLSRAGSFRDIEDRIERMKLAGGTLDFEPAEVKKDATVIMQGADLKPTIGRYEILRELGRGAMGTVYLGKDPKINREVAIKTMRYEEIEEGRLLETKKRFFREAEAAGKLSHPNIVTIYDVGEDSDLAYMAMELLDGADLTRYCANDHLLPAPEVLRIISQVANALDYAHGKGVVHRDIKPSNIMILKNGEVRVADFGIARVKSASRTQTGVVLGTPSYMSPEQIAGQKIDGRSDLFSLGVVLYELLTGEKPFRGESIGSLMYKITTTAPVSIRERIPHLPAPFAEMMDKALEKDAEKRYQRGSEFSHDLFLSIQTLGDHVEAEYCRADR